MTEAEMEPGEAPREKKGPAPLEQGTLGLDLWTQELQESPFLWVLSHCHV